MVDPHTRKAGFYIDRKLDARVRTTMLATMPLEGHRSLSEFICRAVFYEVVRLETRHNNGVPFRLGSGASIPRGRPLRD